MPYANVEYAPNRNTLQSLANIKGAGYPIRHARKSDSAAFFAADAVPGSGTACSADVAPLPRSERKRPNRQRGPVRPPGSLRVLFVVNTPPPRVRRTLASAYRESATGGPCRFPQLRAAEASAVDHLPQISIVLLSLEPSLILPVHDGRGHSIVALAGHRVVIAGVATDRRQRRIRRWVR
jgi:hypothetical protein